MPRSHPALERETSVQSDREFVEYYNTARPHQGIGHAIPHRARSPVQAVQQAPLDADRTYEPQHRHLSLRQIIGVSGASLFGPRGSGLCLFNSIGSIRE
jgi:hypothetical protein